MAASASKMWAAYAFAPAVAPIVFTGIVVGWGILAERGIVRANPAAVLVLPLLAMTVGMLASYAVAATIGMPIAFFLQRNQSLNFLTIHLAALLWSCFFAAGSRLLVGGDGVPKGYAIQWFWYAFAMVTPPTLLSATTFWAILRFCPDRDTREMASETSDSVQKE